jgi:protein TonB
MNFRAPTRLLLSRNLAIGLGVLVLHVGLLWTLQNGLLIRAAQVLVPAEVMSELLTTPAPQLKRAAPPPVVTATPRQVKPAPPVPVPVPVPALAMTSPSPQAAQASVIAAAAPAVPAQTAVAPAVAQAVQLPSSSADYLQNPKPPYPPLSERLGETGRTVYKVWIGVDGKPQRAELVSSSGFPRLDKAAYNTVMGWHYVPGKRGGVAELMAFNVPIHWELRN